MPGQIGCQQRQVAKPAVALRRSETMAVRTTDLAARELPLDAPLGVTLVGTPHDVEPLRPNVVELENPQVALTTVDTAPSPEPLADQGESGSVARVSCKRGAPPLRAAASPRPVAISGSAPVAVCADDLAFRHLFGQARDCGTGVDQPGHVSELLAPDVIELQDHEVCFPAIRACALLQMKQHMIPRPLEPPSAAPLHLCQVPPAAGSEIALEARSAPALPAISGVPIEQLDRKPRLASRAELRPSRHDRKSVRREPWRRPQIWRSDVPDPDTDARLGDLELGSDRATGSSLPPQVACAPALRILPLHEHMFAYRAD